MEQRGTRRSRVLEGTRERRDAGPPLSRRAEEREHRREAHTGPPRLARRKTRYSRSARSPSRVESLAFRELSTLLHLSLPGARENRRRGPGETPSERAS